MSEATMETVADTEPTGRAGVTIDGMPLSDVLSGRLRRVVVDNDLHLPGMFELTFYDRAGTTVAEAGITIGSTVTVSAMGQAATTVSLITAEVTAIEGLLDGLTTYTVVRGYTGAHRLQRASRSRSFLNVTDADVANRIAGEAGLTIGDVVATSTTHAYLAQVNQTDWEFLTSRAREIGFEVGVADGAFYFRPGVDSLLAAGGGMGGMVRSGLQSVADAAGLGTAVLTFPDNLISFRPRVTAGNLTPDVEVRVWDPMTRTAMAQNATTPGGTGMTAESMGSQFTSGGLMAGLSGALSEAEGTFTSMSTSGISSGIESAESSVQDTMSQATGGMLGSPVGFLGSPPSPTAHIVVDKPFADTTTMATEGPMIGRALGTAFGSTFAECEGEAEGNAAIQPNAEVEIQGVQGIFAGKWKISRAKHIFDDSEHGYRVIFSSRGRQDRTMLGLTSKARATTRNSALEGVVCGVVSDCADPLGKGRVKATLPWLSPTFETDWAPNIQFCSGPRSGAMFMPEIGDEVLMAFEFGDVRRPYVLGAMMNNYTNWSIAQSGPIFAGGLGGLGSAALTMAGQAAGAALGGAVAGPLGNIVGGMIGSQIAGQVGSEAIDAASGATVVPGMVSEVHHRGFVSSTGNAIVFYDVPMIPPLPSAADVGSVTGESMDAGGGTDSSLELGSPATGALASAVRIGGQMGETSVTIDQTSAGINIAAAPILGAPESILPNINITTENGFVNIGCGQEGTMMIDGGVNLIIKSTVAITLDAPTINIIGIPLVNGLPIPL